MAHPLKKSEDKRAEPKLGDPKPGPQLGEPKLVETDGAAEITIAQELTGERVADTLIRARQQLGQDLRSIAEVLCIRYSYLDAIERGQYENLPGPTYAMGFVRSYAEYLGLDGDQVVDRFKSEVEGLDSQTKLHFPTPAPEGKMPGGAVFLVAALLFAGAYGVWFYLSNQGESLSDLVAPVPEQLQNMVEGSSQTADSPAAAPAAPAPAAPQAAAPSPAQSQSPAQSPAQSAAQSPGEAAAPAVTVQPESGAAPAATLPSAPETATAASEAAPSAAAPAETPAAAPARPAQSGSAPGTAESTPPSAPAAAQTQESPAPAASPSAGPSTAQSAEVPDAPSAEAPAAAGPGRNEPYAIPVAPDSGTPATAFLLNHEPTVYGQENADARIVLKANQDAWVQVRDRQGNLLLTRVLRVGDSYMVPNQADLTLLTGNAGGLEITVDGSALPPLGPVGAVRRNIPLDPEQLRGGAGREP